MTKVTATSLYFAYGSNLDPAQMEVRCPGAQSSGIARAKGWAFRIYERGYATITKSSDQEIWGGLWIVTDDHLDALDRYEGVSSGLYERTTLTVEVGGRELEAIVYIAELQDDASPSRRYAERVLAGAELFGLPCSYIAGISEVMV